MFFGKKKQAEKIIPVSSGNGFGGYDFLQTEKLSADNLLQSGYQKSIFLNSLEGEAESEYSENFHANFQNIHARNKQDQEKQAQKPQSQKNNYSQNSKDFEYDNQESKSEEDYSDQIRVHIKNSPTYSPISLINNDKSLDLTSLDSKIFGFEGSNKKRVSNKKLDFSSAQGASIPVNKVATSIKVLPKKTVIPGKSSSSSFSSGQRSGSQKLSSVPIVLSPQNSQTFAKKLNPKINFERSKNVEPLVVDFSTPKKASPKNLIIDPNSPEYKDLPVSFKSDTKSKPGLSSQNTVRGKNIIESVTVKSYTQKAVNSISQSVQKNSGTVGSPNTNDDGKGSGSKNQSITYIDMELNDLLRYIVFLLTGLRIENVVEPKHQKVIRDCIKDIHNNITRYLNIKYGPKYAIAFKNLKMDQYIEIDLKQKIVEAYYEFLDNLEEQSKPVHR